MGKNKKKSDNEFGVSVYVAGSIDSDLEERILEVHLANIGYVPNAAIHIDVLEGIAYTEDGVVLKGEKNTIRTKAELRPEMIVGHFMITTVKAPGEDGDIRFYKPSDIDTIWEQIEEGEESRPKLRGTWYGADVDDLTLYSTCQKLFSEVTDDDYDINLLLEVEEAFKLTQGKQTNITLKIKEVATPITLKVPSEQDISVGDYITFAADEKGNCLSWVVALNPKREEIVAVSEAISTKPSPFIIAALRVYAQIQTR